MTNLKQLPKYTFGEEVANSVTHGVMAALSLIALPFSAIHAYSKWGLLAGTSVSIFVISIFLMFLSSTLYHSMARETKHKAVFQKLDHSMIYVAIAGSYTPVALVTIGGWQGIAVVCVQWLIVIFGIIYKCVAIDKLPKLSLTIYLIMGWTVLAVLPTFIQNSNIALRVLIVVGGIFYSSGCFFYAKKGIKYFHMIFHLFINMGVISHYIAIVFFLK